MATTNINQTEFQYQLILSKGKGFLTPLAKKILIELCNGVWQRMEKYYINSDRNDALQSGYLRVFEVWEKYDRTYLPMPYFTEVFKRALVRNYDKNIKNYKKQLSLDDITGRMEKNTQ